MWQGGWARHKDSFQQGIEARTSANNLGSRHDESDPVLNIEEKTLCDLGMNVSTTEGQSDLGVCCEAVTML